MAAAEAATTTMNVDKAQKHQKKQKQQQKSLSLLVLYPELLQHEERMRKAPYDVSGWTLYVSVLDDLIQEAEGLFQNTRNNQEKLVSLGGRAGIRIGDLADCVRDELVPLRLWIATRAVALLPGSYKLWRNHLRFQQSLVRSGKHSFGRTVASYRDALKRLHKAPRIWIDRLEFVQAPHNAPLDVTQWRRTINEALTALPVTQHAKVWTVVLDYIHKNKKDTSNADQDKKNDTDETVVTTALPHDTELVLLRRYVQFHPPYRETLALRCREVYDRPAEAAQWLLEVLNDPSFVSPSARTRYDLWIMLADVCCQHPLATKTVVDFDRIVRGALQKKNSKTKGQTGEEDELLFQTAAGKGQGETNDSNNTVTDGKTLGEMEGALWAKLANYHIRSGEFDLARSIYEEAMDSVSRVRDFSILYDAYIQLEEGILESMMAGQEDEDGDEDMADADDDKKKSNDDHKDADWDILLSGGQGNLADSPEADRTDKKASSGKTGDIEWAMARAEHLTSRRPLLLNKVLLKQNPHNVGEWLHRSSLFEKQGQTRMATHCLLEALKKVYSRRAVNGTPCELVLGLAKLYEKQKDVEACRDLFRRICLEWEYAFRDAEDLAQCFAGWVELELRQEQWDEALSIARQSVASPEPDLSGPHLKLVRGLTKSLRLWDLLLDLEESLGTVQTCKDAYTRAIETKVATPVHVLNYAAFLKEQRYFEEAFAAYERGVEAFDFPAVKVLWKGYLDDFLERYKGSKVERTRDLFSRCLETCPPEDVAEFCTLNGRFEEQHGLTKRALGVYRIMCEKVPDDQRYTAYQLFIAKTTKYLGLPATRDIYQEAVGKLGDKSAAQLCLDFCKMETSMQELDRARGILAYGAQMADPRTFPEYWSAWHEFEVSHGNEETFREMLRIKRSVQAAFSTVNYNATGLATEEPSLSTDDALDMIVNQEGGAVPRKSESEVSGFVTAKRTAPAALEDVENRVAKLRKVVDGAGDKSSGDNAAGGDDDNDEIDIDDVDDEEEEEEGHDQDGDNDEKDGDGKVQNVTTKQVPAAVFGCLSAAGATAAAK